MKRMMFSKIKSRSIATVSIVVFLQVAFFLSNPRTVYAGLFDVGDLSSSSGSLNAGSFGSGVFGSGSLNSVIEDVEKRYHLDPAALQNLGETMNASTNKEIVPQVSIFFNPTDPKNGKNITAQAFPLYFSGQKEALYFTWYLKRKGCDLRTKGQGLNEAQKACDLDGDDAITVNDWKVEAMRRVTNGGFAGDQVDYTQNSTDDDGYKAQFGGDKSVSNYCYVHNFDTGADYELGKWVIIKNKPVWINGCKHLFPQSDVDDTGNGSFGKDEEKFWHTDPNDPSTTQNGNKDEANVVGLGQDKFTWNYAYGDEVGVAIEGLSMGPTKHGDSSMKVMWAFSKNKCVPTGTEQAPVSGAPYNGGVASIPTADMNLNTCIEANLVDPTQGDQGGQLEMAITISPDSPIIDSFSQNEPDNRGSLLTAQSSLVNSVTKESQISYEWRVYANSKQSQTDDSAWEDITQGLLDAHAVSNVSGSDLASLKINLNIDEQTKVNGQSFFERYFKNDAIGYFRVNVTATENFDVGKKRVGRSSAIVKIVRAQAQIQTHAVSVNTTNGKLQFVQSSGSDSGLLCEDSVTDRTICPVVKGQIIGLSFDAGVLGFQPGNGADVSWTLNNQSLHCTNAISTDTACENGTENFFPITGEAGEIYTVTMTVNNPVSGKSITLDRAFRVVEPAIVVVSNDPSKAWPKYLGQYMDASGNATDNYSQSIFETFSGGSFDLKGLFYPNSLKSGANVSWLIDGVLVTPSDTGVVTVTTTQTPGAVYGISLRGVYTPSPIIKKALFDIWGISTAAIVETNLSRDIQVEALQSTDGIALGPLNNSKKFFASIISYVPVSVIFFFRLMVTVGLILIVLGVTFSFVPENRKI